MASFRMTTLFGVLVALLLVTEARRFDFLPSDDDEHCHYAGTCANDTAKEDCMTKCAKDGYNSAGAFCQASVTPTCCCFNDKENTVNPSNDDQNCHYIGTCTGRSDCMMNCENKGFHAGASCISVANYACCCLKDEKIAPNNIP